MRNVSLIFFKLCLPLLLWQGVCSLFKVPTYIFPGVVSVIKMAYIKRFFLCHHTTISMIEVISALCLGIFVAFLTAIFLFKAPRLRKHVMPYLLILKNMPIFVFAPMFMLWFGHGIDSKIFLITLSCYFPMTLGLLDGLSCTPLEIEALLTSLPSKHFFRELLWIRLPYAMPPFFTSLKLAFLHAPLSVIACDWIGASEGLGYVMLIAYGQMDLEVMFACVFILLLGGLFFFKISGVLERSIVYKLNLKYV